MLRVKDGSVEEFEIIPEQEKVVRVFNPGSIDQEIASLTNDIANRNQEIVVFQQEISDRQSLIERHEAEIADKTRFKAEIEAFIANPEGPEPVLPSEVDVVA